MDTVEIVRQAHLAFLYGEFAIFAFVALLCGWRLAQSEADEIGNWWRKLSMPFTGSAARRRWARQSGN